MLFNFHLEKGISPSKAGFSAITKSAPSVSFAFHLRSIFWKKWKYQNGPFWAPWISRPSSRPSYWFGQQPPKPKPGANQATRQNTRFCTNFAGISPYFGRERFVAIFSGGFFPPRLCQKKINKKKWRANKRAVKFLPAKWRQKIHGPHICTPQFFVMIFFCKNCPKIDFGTQIVQKNIFWGQGPDRSKWPKNI